jgi:hypothetical protein
MKEDLKIHKLELPLVRAVDKLSIECWFARKDA